MSAPDQSDNQTVAHLAGWWADRPIATKGIVVVAIPLIALALAFATNRAAQRHAAEARTQVTRTLEVQKQLNHVLSLTIDSETGVRGFLLTREPAYLTPFDDAARQLPAEVDRVVALVGDDPARHAIAERLRADVDRRLAVARELRDADPSDRARIGTLLDAGRTSSDAVRASVAELDRVEATELATSQEEVEDAESTLVWAQRATLLLGFLGGGAALYIFLRSIDTRVRILRDAAACLTDDRPLQARPLGGDEIGQLSEALAEADTLLRRRAEELRLASDAADHANRAKTEFLSRVSHELRTPLNAMLGFAQILELEPLSDEQLADVDQILKGGNHLLTLINEVLDISRIETGDLALSIEPVSLADVVHEAHGLLGPLASRRGVRLLVDPSVRDGELVLADRQRLTQILLNLISNAIKYNREGGTVTVAAARPAVDLVRITVTDTGPGISEANLELLFAPFERLGAERSDVEGTGIGLALSRRLAEAMAGTVAVDSRIGQGSTFWIELPAVAHPSLVDRDQPPANPTSRDRQRARREAFGTTAGPDALADTQFAAPAAAAVVDAGARAEESIDLRAAAAAQAPPGTGPAVLCIDDNVANIRVIEAALQRLDDVTVVAAGQGRLGLDLAREHHPALVLLDLHLPDLTGAEILRMLKQDRATAGIPVIVLSADATPGAAKRLVEQGAVAYLTKPVDVRELLEWVKRATGVIESASPR